MTGDAGISLNAVSKRYGDKAVVDGISLDIKPGEFMTLLGPSGSGKTTTLNMIAGFTQLTTGELRIHGQLVSDVPPHKRDIGMVFQDYALFPHRTVAENIAYPLQRRRTSKSEQRQLVDEALELVRMQDFGARYPAELSGGQQQRVALARALVYKPRVLLMDEPLGALDKKLRDMLQSEIGRIHREIGSTFVYVTHDQEEALALSDRIAVFRNGRIEQVGTAEELYEAPTGLFVGQFLGESTIVSGVPVPTGAAGVIPGPSEAILIRPENILLESVSAAGSQGSGSAPDPGRDRNAIPVTITEVTYLGASRRYTVQLPDGSAGTVRLGREQPQFAVGSVATMTWLVADGVLLSR